MKKLSSLGLISVTIYLLISILTFWYSQVCVSAFCGAGFLLVFMPWLIVFDFLGFDIYSLKFSAIFAFILNIIILYLAFAWLEKVFSKKKDQ